jgi:hypothetical protein
MFFQDVFAITTDKIFIYFANHPVIQGGLLIYNCGIGVYIVGRGSDLFSIALFKEAPHQNRPRH